jgi:acetyl esterase/lipase
MKNPTCMTLLSLASLSMIAIGETAPAPEATKALPPKVQSLIAKLPKGSTHHLDVAYVPGTKPGAKPDSVQTLDLYVPAGKGPFPLVFWIHGGGWHSGDKLESGINLALKFLPKGFALASINYRLTGDAPFPAQIEDCNAALAYLRQRADTYRIDSNRVGTLGHSAGAHLAALMACTGNEKRFSPDAQQPLGVQAAVCWAIPADLDRDRGQWPKTSMMHNAGDRPLWKFFPSNGYDGEFARMASPASYVHAGVPPIHIVHGQLDDLVPPGQAMAFAESLKKFGAPMTLRMVPDLGHNVMNAKSVDEAVSFFTRVLKADKS